VPKERRTVDPQLAYMGGRWQVIAFGRFNVVVFVVVVVLRLLERKNWL